MPTIVRPAVGPVMRGGRRCDTKSCVRRCAGLCTADGFASAHRQHVADMLRVARYRLGDEGLAEDAVQEAFVKAWRACGSFDPTGPPLRAWLRAILRNVVIDCARHRSARPPLHAAEPPREDITARPVPCDETGGVLLRDALAGALDRISADHRRVVLLTVVHDRPNEEVAVTLGIPVGTVKSRRHHALRRLRSLLDPAA